MLLLNSTLTNTMKKLLFTFLISGLPLLASSKGAQVKYYSSIVIINDLYLTRDFIEWFRGFVDAEGLFSIGKKIK